MPATKYLWAINALVVALMTAVNGLCTTIDLLLQPSILYADMIQAMFRRLFQIFSKENGKTYPDHMDDILIVRIQKNAEEIRAFNFDNNSSLQARIHWNGSSKSP